MRQRLGQHFLRDPKVLQAIVAAAELTSSDCVLEIGPGRGALTDSLAGRAASLTAIELDDELAPMLAERYRKSAQIRVIHQDVLKADLVQLFPDAHRHPVKVLGNLPYSITSPIFEKLMPWSGWSIGVFLIQMEVAERVQAREGSRAFGLLTLAVQLFAEAEKVLTVPPGAFAPPPEVTSAVIRLRRRARPLVDSGRLADFFDFARGAFSHRRKTLANSLALHTGAGRAAIETWLEKWGIDGRVRAEDLSLDHYVKMAEPWSFFRREIKLTPS